MSIQAEMEVMKTAKVLMVGAGGIGCELLKTLVMTGFEDIELIDLDTIDISNLNRQFLFRKHHVGQSKAKVAREAALLLRPFASIKPHHGNVMSQQFDVDFFRSFSVVLNGLDNLDARRHVNRMCLAAGVPLVESGTTGYLGQVSVHIKGLTQCYECEPKPTPKTYPTCTITNTPSKPVHCIVWAKELPFLKLFGSRDKPSDLDAAPAAAPSNAIVSGVQQQRNDTSLPSGDASQPNKARHPSDHTSTGVAEGDEDDFFDLKDGESHEVFAARVFDQIFGHNVARTLEMEDLWKSRPKPKPLYLRDVLPDGSIGEKEGGRHQDKQEEGKGPELKPVSAMAEINLPDAHAQWTLQENARVFLKSVCLFLSTRKEEIGSLTFDKDDQLAVEFVTSASNLRCFSFSLPTLSLFDAKGIAGNIIHAVATTNAIVAGIIVLQACKLVQQKREEAAQLVWCNEEPTGRGNLLQPIPMEPPKPKCFVCSQTPLVLEIDTRACTLQALLTRVVKGRLGVVSPMLMHGNFLLYETGDDLEEEEVEAYEKNLKKLLLELSPPLSSGSVLAVEDYQQQFKCVIHLKHREVFDEETEPEHFILHGVEHLEKRQEDGKAAADMAESQPMPNAANVGPVSGSKRKATGDALEEGTGMKAIEEIREDKVEYGDDLEMYVLDEGPVPHNYKRRKVGSSALPEMGDTIVLDDF